MPRYRGKVTSKKTGKVVFNKSYSMTKRQSVSFKNSLRRDYSSAYNVSMRKIK